MLFFPEELSFNVGHAKGVVVALAFADAARGVLIRPIRDRDEFNSPVFPDSDLFNEVDPTPP
jgi:hypothetical protein